MRLHIDRQGNQEGVPLRFLVQRKARVVTAQLPIAMAIGSKRPSITLNSAIATTWSVATDRAVSQR